MGEWRWNRAWGDKMAIEKYNKNNVKKSKLKSVFESKTNHKISVFESITQYKPYMTEKYNCLLRIRKVTVAYIQSPQI